VNISSFGRRLLAAANGTFAGTIIGLGTAAFKNTGTSGNTVPLLDGSNTWSALQTFSTSAAFGTVAAYTSTDAGAGNGPFVELYRNSASPAASDGQGAVLWFFNNASAVKTNGAYFGATLTDPTAGAENYQLNFVRMVNGALLTGFSVGVNFVVSAPLTIANYLTRSAPVTKTADFTVAVSENWLINNKAAATCTVTLPAAASFTGREIMIKNLQAFTVVSASSNVVPLAGGAAGTAILSANAGRFCTLVSDGTNWIIMAGVI
jgi:hypothetical protein